MWNLFKKNNKEIESLKQQISELQSSIKKQNQTIEELTGDRDYWKSQYEQLIDNFDPNDAKLGEEIKIWVSKKMIKNIQDSRQIENLQKRVDNATPEETVDIFEKITTIKIESTFLNELGRVIIKYIN